jgi:hypothetical protein
MHIWTRKTFLFVSLIILFLFCLFLINQTAQVVILAQSVSPDFGRIVLGALLICYALMVLIPIYFYIRLPQVLSPPDSEDSPEFQDYLSRLSQRLGKNVHLESVRLESRADIEAALKTLGSKADQIVKKSASIVFVSTAISQSGRLDAFTVLFAQVKMVWQIAKIFYQRPSLRDIIKLYANVAATAFVADELNEIDISKQVEPVITSVMGTSLSASIPGMSKLAGIVTNSLLTGAANAYLTLRVGAIAKSYCTSLTRKEKGFLRRSAMIEAARMLGKIVMNSTASITRAFMAAAVKTPGKLSRDIITSSWEKISRRKE